MNFMKQSVFSQFSIKSPYFKARNWNLDFKNPRGGEVEEELSSKELIERILGKEDQIKDLFKKI